jgi:uncharacterized membrane protein HdeD (DUF308 family)
MSGHAASPRFGTPGVTPELRAATREMTGYWWLWLIGGIAWIVVSLVILQFDSASITTVGVLVGLMLALASIQSFEHPELRPHHCGRGRGLDLGFFGVLLLVAAVICFISPEGTFAALADTLGFVLFFGGVRWMIEAFLEREFNSLWWLWLISGILMMILAFWTAGQFFIEKAYVLLVFAGIWALMEVINDIVRAFAIRGLHEEVSGGTAAEGSHT